MNRIATLILCVLLTSFGSTRIAYAVDPQIETLARAHFEKGRKLSDDHHYLEALSEFSAGYELSMKPLFLFNMAECSRSLGNNQRALDEYQRYIAADPKGKLAPLARDRVNELSAALAAPSPTPAPVVTPTPTPVVTPTPGVDPVPPGSAEPRADLVAAVPGPPARKPVWKRTGFWVGIGSGVAVVIVVGAVAGWAVNRNNGPCGGVSACADLRTQ